MSRQQIPAPDHAILHPSADVQTTHIGEGTTVWQYVVILPGAVIGRNCNICSHCLIENDVIIGDNVTIKCGVQLWDGLRVANDVFIGANATFTNDLYPRSKQYPEKFLKTEIGEGASVGANSTILAGRRIGKHAMIGAGCVVSHDIPPFTLWYGVPARHMGYVTADGEILGMDLISTKTGKQYIYRNETIKPA